MHDVTRLICFTYAGGTSAFFNEIESELKGVEVIKPEYAGHGQRHNERFYNEFNDMTEDMLSIIREDLDSRYAMFGYSMGCITLVEVLGKIINLGLPMPIHVFLAAHEPHTKTELAGFSTDESDDWVRERTIRFGAVPDKLINNNVFWRTYLPIYRADYNLIGQYKFEKLKLNTKIPATVFYSETDTPRSEMKLWEKYFTGECDFRYYEGSHFFIREHYVEMAGVITRKLQEKV